MRYVYFLLLSSEGLYVGSTNDLRWHLKSHQAREVASTAKYLAAILKAYVA
jgi:predicted GIY-YIG superfamily endonuclease